MKNRLKNNGKIENKQLNPLKINFTLEKGV